jgi:signal transduction histidine kinase
MLIADVEGTVVMADPVARWMLHLPASPLGLPLHQLYSGNPGWATTVRNLLVGRTDASRRAHLSLAEAEPAVEVDFQALMRRDGKIDGVVVTLHTTEGPVEQREMIMEMVSDFRIPMTSLIGYTDLLLGEQVGQLSEMQRQFLLRVKANVEQLEHLFNDLFHFIEPASRTVNLSPEPVDLIAIIREAIVALGTRIVERKVTVRLDVPATLAMVKVDRDSFYQITLRLLSNAVLASPPDSDVVVRVRYQRESEQEPAFIQVSVKDFGEGIPSAELPRVFQRFYRADQPLIVGMGETGMGMSISRSLVESNGGRIWVESKPGEGSSFNFVLPLE